MAGNRVKVVASGGAGNITLSAALASFTSFANGTCTYCILSDTGEWEIGRGTVTGSTLVRDTVEDNHLGTTATIDFTAMTLRAAEVISGGEYVSLILNQTWEGAQRALPTDITDGSINMTVGNDFVYTPAAGDQLEFTTVADGQRGMIRVINPSAYLITLGTEIDAALGAATILSTAGSYILSYWCYDGTNVRISVSRVDA